MCVRPREQLAASILQEGSAGCRVVEKFLKILQVVVQEPGQAFKPFLPSIIALCMEQVYPIVAEVRVRTLIHTDIKIKKRDTCTVCVGGMSIDGFGHWVSK